MVPVLIRLFSSSSFVSVCVCTAAVHPISICNREQPRTICASTSFSSADSLHPPENDTCSPHARCMHSFRVPAVSLYNLPTGSTAAIAYVSTSTCPCVCNHTFLKICVEGCENDRICICVSIHFINTCIAEILLCLYRYESGWYLIRRGGKGRFEEGAYPPSCVNPSHRLLMPNTKKRRVAPLCVQYGDI